MDQPSTSLILWMSVFCKKPQMRERLLNSEENKEGRGCWREWGLIFIVLVLKNKTKTKNPAKSLLRPQYSNTQVAGYVVIPTTSPNSLFHILKYSKIQLGEQVFWSKMLGGAALWGEYSQIIISGGHYITALGSVGILLEWIYSGKAYRKKTDLFWYCVFNVLMLIIPNSEHTFRSPICNCHNSNNTALFSLPVLIITEPYFSRCFQSHFIILFPSRKSTLQHCQMVHYKNTVVSWGKTANILKISQNCQKAAVLGT